MMRGIGGEFFFSILGYRRGIARVSPEIRELSCLVFCLVLSCRCCCYCCWFCAGFAGPAAAVAAAYLPTTELRASQGAHTAGVTLTGHWPGDRGGNSPACLRPTSNACLVGHESRAMRKCACSARASHFRVCTLAVTL